MIQDLWQDLRFGLRMLWKNPGVTAIAVLSLALGIGANTAIFSLIDATLLRMLPVKDPQQLALFSITRQGQRDYDFSYPLFERLRETQRAFSGLMAASSPNPMRLQAQDAGGTVETVQQERVTGNYFSVLGVNASLGRMLNIACAGTLDRAVGRLLQLVRAVAGVPGAVRNYVPGGAAADARDRRSDGARGAKRRCRQSPQASDAMKIA